RLAGPIFSGDGHRPGQQVHQADDRAPGLARRHLARPAGDERLAAAALLQAPLAPPPPPASPKGVDMPERPIRSPLFHHPAVVAGQEADAADAIDARVVMAPAGFERLPLGVLRAGRLVADRPAVANADRVPGIVAGDAPVLDVDARDAVAGRRDDEGVVKAD